MPTDPKESPAKSEPREAKSSIAYKYTGNGDHLVGIPARDLTEDDVQALKGTFTEPAGEGTRDATKKTIEASGLYEKGGG